MSFYDVLLGLVASLACFVIIYLYCKVPSYQFWILEISHYAWLSKYQNIRISIKTDGWGKGKNESKQVTLFIINS